MTDTKDAVTDVTRDAAADRIVDIAVAAARTRMTHIELDEFRTEMQDAVDALIDQDRAYYKALFSGDATEQCQSAANAPIRDESVGPVWIPGKGWA